MPQGGAPSRCPDRRPPRTDRTDAYAATAGAAAIAARIAEDAPLVASCSVLDDTLMYRSVVCRK